MTKGAFMHDLNAYRALDAKRQKEMIEPPHNWGEYLIMSVIILLLVGACVSLRGKRSTSTIDQEYQATERTITIEPTTIEWYEPCMEDMPCWDCRTMGNKICGTKDKE